MPSFFEAATLAVKRSEAVIFANSTTSGRRGMPTTSTLSRTFSVSLNATSVRPPSKLPNLFAIPGFTFAS